MYYYTPLRLHGNKNFIDSPDFLCYCKNTQMQ